MVNISVLLQKRIKIYIGSTLPAVAIYNEATCW